MALLERRKCKYQECGSTLTFYEMSTQDNVNPLDKDNQ